MLCGLCDTLKGFIYAVGVYSLVLFLYENFKSPAILLYARLRKTELKSLRQRFGEWAVVTGSTDGIGKAYARELARQGINVVLISRTETKLQAVAKQIESDFGVKTKIIVADFSKGEPIYAHIEQELGDLRVGILVNNVGQNTTDAGYMASLPVSENWHMINTNVGSVMHLSHMFLRRMRDAGIKGIIVNVASLTSLNPCPYIALYSATKKFVINFTLALQYEARPWGIEVQLLSPWFVATKLIAPMKIIANGNLLVPQAEDFARSAVSTLGKVDNTTGHFWHGVQDIVAKILPWQLLAYLYNFALPYIVQDLKTT